ncbi:hypothetical protein [Acinetobacter sp. ESBL14]|uniref:hypothetical protein n=1 Tax=Acinetobacter sp. ESBL14 TaxID=3077329 RepID=UPI002FCC77AF
MNENEIYQNLGKLLWSIMAEDVGVIFCEGYIYPDSSSYSFEWLTKNNKMGWFDFDQIPHEIGDKVIHLMENHIKLDVFKEKWTQFKISLTRCF